MSELVEFLKARLDEDEQVAKATVMDGISFWTAQDSWLGLAAPVVAHAQRHDPARVLAEVEAKRLQLALHKECDASCYVVRVLALPYASHPDYREEWRP